ncbi:hypothetical protein [Roseivirga sp.]|uniref:hypothetical protein n=1 Tax=Roseivirga sp. TaxID=1964215 RepID=UPI003B8C7BFC
MTNKKKKSIPKTALRKGKTKEEVVDKSNEVEDDFDFGGFPKGVDLKKNLGCGG